MAGDWIKVENVTPDKPEVYQMAEALNIDPDAVTGKLLRVWIWADEQTIDGNANGVTRMLLDRLTGVTGFADVMLQTPWLEEKNGQLVFVNFDRHNGKGAKKRAESNRRVSKHREKLKQECNAENVTKIVTREEKRREENITTKKNNKKKSFPTDFDLSEERRSLATKYWNDKSRTDLSDRANEIFEEFKNYCLANGKTYLDWNAAWVTWYTNAIKFERQPNANSFGNHPTKSELADQAARDYLREHA